MSNLPRPASRPAGFTIIELIVAISITALMLFLVNRIFNDTNRAVSRGIELSEVISQERALQKHLQNDIAAMMGPQGAPGSAAASGSDINGGPLVIVQHAVLNRTFDLPDSPTVDTAVRDVRADQLMFVRERGEEKPIVPSSPSGFTPHATDGTTPYMRVWYGHLLRTNDDGSDYGTAVDLDNTTNFLDQRPTSWLLGRQALFLTNGGGSVSATNARGGFVDAPTVGYGTGANAPSWASTYAGSRPPLYMGLADTANFSLEEASASTHGSMIGNTTAGTNGATSRLSSTLAAADYQDRALEHFTFARTRLRTNDRPPDPLFSTWQIAQMHPTIAEGVSDFIVEFAADADNDGIIDRVSTTESNNMFGDDRFTGVIKWYTHDAYVNREDSTGPLGNSPAGAGTYDDTKPLTFELPAGAFKTNVYVADINTTLPSAPFEAGTAAFVWRHDRYDPNPTGAGPPPGNAFCDWPYLLRIRYRMHDPQGDLASAEGQHGVWFEQVLKVNRPYVP